MNPYRPCPPLGIVPWVVMRTLVAAVPRENRRISTPFLVHWPEGLKNGGVTIKQPAHVIDLLPTIFDLAGVESAPEEKGAVRPGRSLLETLRGAADVSDRDLWWQHEENRAFRRGDWKIVAAKGDPWELYDLSSDRAETRNLAGEQPDRVSALEAAWESNWEAFQRSARGSP